MSASVIVLLDTLACITILFSISILIFRRNSILWLDNSFLPLLLSLTFFFISNLLESTAVSVALDPYENFLLPFIWIFWFFAMLKKIQLIELEKAHNKLIISEQNIRILLQNLPQKISLKNRYSEYITCNENYAADLNRIPEEITGKTDFDLYPAEVAEKYRKDDHRIMISAKTEETDEKYVQNGHTKWMHTIKTPALDETGKVIGILGISWDVTEQRKMREHLRESEERFRKMFINAALGISITDLEERIEHCNPAYYKLLGYTEEELHERTISSLIHPDDRDANLIMDRRLLAGEMSSFEIENRYINKDGHTVWVHKYKSILTDETGIPRHMIALITDMTERRNAEQRVKASEEKLRLFLDNFSGIAYQAPLSTFQPTFFYGAVEKITGYTSDVFTQGRITWNDLIHPEDQKIVYEEEKRLHDTQEHFADNEYRIVTRNNSVRWVHDFARNVNGIDGKPIIQGSIFDITERKLAEEALKKSEERLRLAQESAHIGIWEYDLRSGKANWTKELELIHGITENTFLESYSAFRKCVHPDDLEKLERTQNEAIRDHRTFELDFRIITPSGEIRWVNTKGAALYDESGHPTTAYGVSTDTTERKKAELTLLDSEENLRTTLNSIADAVIATDTAGLITRINPAAERLTGWRNGKAIGTLLTEVFFIVNSDSGKTVSDLISRVLHTGTISSLPANTRLISRDDREFQIADSVAPICGIKGEITGVVLVFRDVTEEYTIRKELQESEERYRLFYETSPFAIMHVKSFKMCHPNQSAIKLYGISEEELINTYTWELSPERQPDGSLSRDKALFYMKEALAGHPQYFEWVHQRRDGTQFDVEVALTRVYLKGEPQITATVVDVTDRKRALKNLTASLHEKEILLQEIYHRTKNSMMVISAFLELQAASMENKEVNRIIHDSVTRIRTMSLAHEMLYKGRSLSRINMQEYIKDLAQILATGSSISPEQVSLHFEIEKIEILIDIAIPCGLIINELLSNCFKYAFPDQRKGIVTIGLKRSGEKQLELSIKDNGVGLAEGFDIMQTETLGVQIVTQIAHHQLNATINVLSENGLSWYITFREDLYAERV